MRFLPKQVVGTLLSLVMAHSLALANTEPLKRAATSEDTTRQPESQDGCDPAECGRGAEVYRDMAESTGGFVYAGPAEFWGQAMGVIMEATSPSVQHFLSVRGVVDSPDGHVLTVPIDGTVKRIDFVAQFLKSGSATLEIRRPNGRAVIAGDPDADLLDIPLLRRVRVVAPAVGIWQMAIKGRGEYVASAMGETGIAFVGLTFNRPIAAGAEGGEERVAGDLLLNETIYFDAVLSGDVRNPAFELVSPDGRRLEALTLDKDAVGGFMGDYRPTVPVRRFFVQATGQDAKGAPFQRILRRPFAVSTLGVRQHRSPPRVAEGRVTYRFECENRGPAGRFAVRANSFRELPLKVSEELLELGTGQVARVDVTLPIPPETEDEEVTLIVSLASTTDRTIRNWTSVDVSFARETRPVARFYAILQREPGEDGALRRAMEYLEGLPRADRAEVARVIAADPNARVGYAGTYVLIEEGYIDEAVPPLAAMIVSGRDRTHLNGRMGYDWLHHDDDTVFPRMMIKISRYLLSHLEEYGAEDRRRVEEWLVGEKKPFSISAAQEGIADLEAKLRAAQARTDPSRNGPKGK